MQVVQTSFFWRSDSTQCLMIIITFQSFANGIKVIVTETLLPKFIQNLFTCAEGYEVRVLCILLNENYCLKAELLKQIRLSCYALVH